MLQNLHPIKEKTTVLVSGKNNRREAQSVMNTNQT